MILTGKRYCLEKANQNTKSLSPGVDKYIVFTCGEEARKDLEGKIVILARTPEKLYGAYFYCEEEDIVAYE